MEYAIDCSGITTAQQMHQLLAQALRFPQWYGHNLDALYDCLTESTEETLLILRHWPASPLFAGFEDVFQEVQQEFPSFRVQFE